MRTRINKHYQEIMERDNYVTAEKVKNAFLGLEHRYHTLMQVFNRHNEDYEKQVEAGMKAKATLSKYKTVYKHLQEFLNIRYHVKDIAVKELTPAFISDFEMFLRTDKHCCTNTVWLYVCPLRTMVFIAINNEWLTRDPFREYEIKKEETTRSFLTKDEIRQLMEGKLKNAKQELYRDLYLFCAFTGLSFADMRNLTEENIRTYFDDHEWININRQKTGVVSNIRLLDIAKRIIDKYRGLCEDGKIFPVPHYMTCLYGIRAVAKRCGITKHITWHQSRHTAATTVFLSNGVPIETVSSMLGHKSIKTTQIYAKITKEKLNQDMESLATYHKILIMHTNENLEKAVSEKRFRQDLLYRLHDFEITVPPLRDCLEDVMPLAEFFREIANKELECRVEGFSSEARKALLSYPWPGNVRELQQKIMGAVLQAQEGAVRKEHLELGLAETSASAGFALRNDAEEKERIMRALKQSGGNRYTAAKILGIGRTTLYKKLEEYGLKYKFEQS